MSILEHQINKFAHRLIEIDVWAWFAVFTPFFIFIQKYVYSDWNFLISLGVLVFLDLFTGIWKAKKKGVPITSYGLRSTGAKISQYGVFLIVLHVLVSFQVNGNTIGILSYSDESGYTFLIVIEAKSILENLQVIDSRFDYSGLIDKLKDFLPKKKE